MRWTVALVMIGLLLAACAGADGDPAPPPSEAGADALLAPCDAGVTQ